LDTYRTLSKLAVTSLVLGLFSLTGLMFPVLLAFSVAGLASGLLAVRAIRRYPDELSGRGAAFLGTALCVLTLFGGTTLHSVVYATEVPEGYARLSFERLKSRGDGPDQPPQEVLELDGQRVFVKGYIYNTGQQSQLKRFVLVPDLGTCCFGGQPKLTHMIEVTLEDPLRIDFSMTRRKLAGTIHIDRSLKPISGLGGVYYQLTADYVR
jgi:hypothetical protein